MHLHPRGRLSAAVMEALSDAPGAEPSRLPSLARAAVDATSDLVTDDDAQLALYLLLELHYSGNVMDAEGFGTSHRTDWEWDADLLRTREVLGCALETQLRETFTRTVPDDLTDVPNLLFAMAQDGSDRPARPHGWRGPASLPTFVARQATLEQLREVIVLRSPYQLKEADPHTFAIPRLRGRAKAALVDIQTDEYGGGRTERMHQELFARTMRAVGLDDRSNAYLEAVPAVTLASANALSHLALHRRLRGALCGHLAAFEMTSSLPAKRYVAGMQRLGLGEDAWMFFDEHIEADAVHEQIAARDLCGGLLDDEPELAADVLFGAATCLGLDLRGADHVLSAFARQGSALRVPLPEPAPGSAPALVSSAPALVLLPGEPAHPDGPDASARATG